MPLVVDWWLFAPAVILLLFPGDRLMSPQVELLNFDRASHRSRSSKCPRWAYMRWLEPLRGFGGAFVLKVSLPLTSDLWHCVSQAEYSLFVGVLLLGMILQLFTRREEDALLASVGYAVGLLFALVPWPVALVGLIAGITSLFAFRQMQVFWHGCGGRGRDRIIAGGAGDLAASNRGSALGAGYRRTHYRPDSGDASPG